MKILSLKLQEPLYLELESLIAQLQKNRNAYLNEAVEYYNKVQRRRLLEKQLEEECLLVKDADYEVFKEMEAMEDPID